MNQLWNFPLETGGQHCNIRPKMSSNTLYLVSEGIWAWSRWILEVLWMHDLPVQTWPLLLVRGSKSGCWFLKQGPVWMKHAVTVLSTETGLRHISHILWITAILICTLTSFSFWDTRRFGFSFTSLATLPNLLSWFLLLSRPLNAGMALGSVLDPLFIDTPLPVSWH